MEIKDGAVFAAQSEDRCAKEQPRESAWDSQELRAFPKFGQLLICAGSGQDSNWLAENSS